MDELVDKIRKLLDSKKTSLIAIDGIPGSGKTTLCDQISRILSGVEIIKIDNFYDPVSENTDFDRLIKEVFAPLKINKTAYFKIFDWNSNSFTGVVQVQPGGVVIIEGISALDRRIVSQYDLKIWVDCPVEVGLRRVLKRDKVKFKKMWQEKWMPEIIDFVNRQKPYEKADILISYRDIHE